VSKSISNLFFLFVVILALSPLANLISVWPLNNAITAGITFAVCGLIFGTCSFFAREANVQLSAPIYLVVAFIVIVGISAFANSYEIEAAWRWYLVHLVFCAFLILGASEFKSQKPERFNSILAFSLWFSSIVYSAISLLKYYGLLSFVVPWVEVSDSRLSGIWNQPNLTTTTAWIGLVATSVVFRAHLRSASFFMSVIILGWVIVCAASRASWLIFAGFSCLIIVSGLSKYRIEEVQYARKSLLVSLLLVAILFVSVPPINDALRSFLANQGILERNIPVALIDRSVTKDTARLSEIAKVVENLGSLTPMQWIVGFGPGNYPAFSFKADMQLTPEKITSLPWLHSHNIFTMVFVEFGVFGLLVLLSFLYFIFRHIVATPLDLKSFFSVGALSVIFIHSNLEYPLWYSWFLVVTCLLLVNIFTPVTVKADSLILKRTVGGLIIAMTLMLLVNVGYQYLQIVKVAVDSDPGEKQYQSLVVLANDSLMGPYAVLRKYRDFAPESRNLDWQLNEARRMKAWQPRDLVLLREYSILVLKGDVDEACNAAENTAYRYPRSAPIMLEHAIKSGVLTPQQTIRLANCIEMGLAPRGETIPSVQQKNQRSLSRM